MSRQRISVADRRSDISSTSYWVTSSDLASLGRYALGEYNADIRFISNLDLSTRENQYGSVEYIFSDLAHSPERLKLVIVNYGSRSGEGSHWVTLIEKKISDSRSDILVVDTLHSDRKQVKLVERLTSTYDKFGISTQPITIGVKWQKNISTCGFWAFDICREFAKNYPKVVESGAKLNKLFEEIIVSKFKKDITPEEYILCRKDNYVEVLQLVDRYSGNDTYIKEEVSKKLGDPYSEAEVGEYRDYHHRDLRTSDEAAGASGAGYGSGYGSVSYREFDDVSTKAKEFVLYYKSLSVLDNYKLVNSFSNREELKEVIERVSYNFLRYSEESPQNALMYKNFIIHGIKEYLDTEAVYLSSQGLNREEIKVLIEFHFSVINFLLEVNQFSLDCTYESLDYDQSHPYFTNPELEEFVSILGGVLNEGI